MWKIFVTIAVGSLPILTYKIIKYILDNCYMYKTSDYRRSFSLVRNFGGCVYAVSNILRRQTHSYRVLGMDCEWMSTSVNGGHPVPAILQLATADGYMTIFQLKVIENSQDKITVPYLTDRPRISQYKMPSEDIIRQVLEDPNILKVGVAVMNDAKYLEESYGLICKGCLDVRYMAKLAGIPPKGLDFLAKKVLGKEKVELKKNEKKPWESDLLSSNQIRYATQDSLLGVELFLELNRKVIERSYSWLWRLFWDENTYWKYSIKLWRGYIGEQFHISRHSNFEQTESWTSYITGLSIFRRSFVFESARARRVFYIEKLCFVCGIHGPHPAASGPDVRLKAMVPVDYRIDLDWGDENLYYICLCKMCSEDCRKKVDYELRQELTEECGAPPPDYEDHRLEKTKKLAMELLASGKSNMEWRRILECSLEKLLPGLPEEEFKNETLEIILSMDCWPESEHGKFVHEYFFAYGGGLSELHWRWCERFWRVMRPQFLPQRWKNFYRRDPRWDWITS